MRTRLRLVVAAFVWAGVSGLALAQTSVEGRRPNIVLILADDLGYGDLGAYGQAVIQTPHLDKMAARGMRFTQFYAGASVCAPSRGVLMTGQHNGRGRVRDNIPYGAHLLREDLTVAEVLQRAGYRTGMSGKWSLGDHWEEGAPWRKGFEAFFGYPNQDHAHFYYPHFIFDHDRVKLLPGNRPGKRPTQYVPDLMQDWALTFIEKQKEDPRPFFLYYALNLPHWSEFPRMSDESHIVPSDAPYSNQTWPQVEKNYAAMVTRLDRYVGDLMNKLEELGLADNTLVVFTSDNGPSAESVHRVDFFNSNGPFRGHKRLHHEGGVRVPAIMHWPAAIPAGKVNDMIGGFWDIMPTFAELAGVPGPRDIHGISFAPVLAGGQREREHEYLYWDYGHARPQFSQAVRAGEWKAVRAALDRPIELYNVVEDPGETRNLATEYPGVVARMETLISEAFVPSEHFAIKSARPTTEASK